MYRRRIENASWRLWHIRDVAPTYQVVKLRHRAAGFLLQKPIGDDTDGDADADKPMMVRRPHAKTHLDLTSRRRASYAAAVGEWRRCRQRLPEARVQRFWNGRLSPAGVQHRVRSRRIGHQPLRYLKHKIIKGRGCMLDDVMPHVRVGSDDATTLIVTLVDPHTNFEVDLSYTAIHARLHRALCHISCAAVPAIWTPPHMRAHSQGDERLVDFEAELGGYHFTHLAGSWARERHVTTIPLRQGTSSIGSTRGTSSHAHNPFAVLRGGEPREEEGVVYGFGSGSGNHLFEAHQNEVGRVRVSSGINPTNFVASRARRVVSDARVPPRALVERPRRDEQDVPQRRAAASRPAKVDRRLLPCARQLVGSDVL